MYLEKGLMSVLEKVKVLDKLDRGVTVAVVGCHYVINWSTYFIKKNEDKFISWTGA
jgi:uncharacterized membrane protein